MTGFTNHGIKHLSASQITTFAADPSYWLATKLLGYRSPPSTAMARGKAVEVGVVAFACGKPMPDATAKAEAAYRKELRWANHIGDVDAEGARIPAMVQQAAEAVADLGKPELPDHGEQHKIELLCVYGNEPDQQIPVIGYLDLVYPAHKVVTDLKTTTRVPSSMSWAHRVQRSIYARATGYTTRFLYASEKKTAWLEDGDIERTLADVKTIVRRMDAFLSLGDATALRAAVPVTPDSFYWREAEAAEARRNLYGI